MSPGSKQAVHFGAGNIGRGFIGPLLAEGGYHVVFADVDEKAIDHLNSYDSYEVHILDGRAKGKSSGEKTDHITNVSGVISTQPDAVRELASRSTQLVTTAVGPAILARIAPALAKGLSARRKADAGGLNVIACENKVGATKSLREEVFKAFEEDEDREWAERFVGFANCSVDRIVPPFEPEEDAALDVGVEGFFEWVVEGAALKDPKPTVKGMTLTDSLDAYVERKLYTLNTGHAIAAYLGYLRGVPTIDAAMADAEIHKHVRSALDESGAALIKKHDFKSDEHEQYIEKIESRFRNSSLKDEVVRVGRQPLRKLSKGDRLLGPVEMCNEYGLPREHLLRGVAAAFLYDGKGDEEAKDLQERIGKDGLEKVVVEVTGFDEGGEEVEKVVKAYEELKKWKKS